MWSATDNSIEHSDFCTLFTIDQVAVVSFIADDFVGEESPATVGGLHLATATPSPAFMALKIEREEMVRAMHEEHSLPDLFDQEKYDLVENLKSLSSEANAITLRAEAVWSKSGSVHGNPLVIGTVYSSSTVANRPTAHRAVEIDLCLQQLPEIRHLGEMLRKPVAGLATQVVNDKGDSH